jgi:hypothetical protein
MQEDQNSNKVINTDIELSEEEPAFRTVKSCPKCHSIAVTYRKWKRDYCCRNCLESFNNPVFKQIKDRRNELPIPLTLRRTVFTEQTDKRGIR